MKRLSELIRIYRAVKGVGVRELAKEIGVTASTLNRVERGYPCESRVLSAILRWMLAEG